MRYARFRHSTPTPPAPPVALDDEERTAAHDLVMSARFDDLPADTWLAPLDDLALTRAARDRYAWATS
jgi:hypothetical protein